MVCLENPSLSSDYGRVLWSLDFGVGVFHRFSKVYFFSFFEFRISQFQESKILKVNYKIQHDDVFVQYKTLLY